MNNYDEIYNICKTILKDEDWASDATQDIYTILAEREIFDAPYTKVVAKYHCYDLLEETEDVLYLEDIGDEFLSWDEMIASESDSPEDLMIEKEDMEYANELLLELSPKQQEVISRVLEGFSTDEVAEDLGITYHAVSNRLTRAYAGLRNLSEVI